MSTFNPLAVQEMADEKLIMARELREKQRQGGEAGIAGPQGTNADAAESLARMIDRFRGAEKRQKVQHGVSQNVGRILDSLAEYEQAPRGVTAQQALDAIASKDRSGPQMFVDDAKAAFGPAVRRGVEAVRQAGRRFNERAPFEKDRVAEAAEYAAGTKARLEGENRQKILEVLESMEKGGTAPQGISMESVLSAMEQANQPQPDGIGPARTDQMRSLGIAGDTPGQVTFDGKEMFEIVPGVKVPIEQFTDKNGDIDPDKVDAFIARTNPELAADANRRGQQRQGLTLNRNRQPEINKKNFLETIDKSMNLPELDEKEKARLGSIDKINSHERRREIGKLVGNAIQGVRNTELDNKAMSRVVEAGKAYIKSGSDRNWKALEGATAELVESAGRSNLNKVVATNQNELDKKYNDSQATALDSRMRSGTYSDKDVAEYVRLLDISDAIRSATPEGKQQRIKTLNERFSRVLSILEGPARDAMDLIAEKYEPGSNDYNRALSRNNEYKKYSNAVKVYQSSLQTAGETAPKDIAKKLAAAEKYFQLSTQDTENNDDEAPAGTGVGKGGEKGNSGGVGKKVNDGRAIPSVDREYVKGANRKDLDQAHLKRAADAIKAAIYISENGGNYDRKRVKTLSGLSRKYNSQGMEGLGRGAVDQVVAEEQVELQKLLAEKADLHTKNRKIPKSLDRKIKRREYAINFALDLLEEGLWNGNK
jgi:hypothetical protein